MRISAESLAILVISALGIVSVGSFTAGGATEGPAMPDPATAATQDIPFSRHLLVDQFGYRPADAKVAVIRDPKAGYDAVDAFEPGPAYELRDARDGHVVFNAAPVPWNGGAVEASSGDRGWWFDFSRVSAPGRYFVYDAARNVRSAAFEIGPDVYHNALKAAVRMYFYQRSGRADGGGAKSARDAGDCWQDPPAYVGPGQDTEARDVTDQQNPAKARDLSGGWFDAGDTNKYVTFAANPVHQLLTAYQNNPKVFTDDFGIPESGNGIPDLLDEIRYEMDWLGKMQFYADGRVALKVGVLGFASASPPSSDRSPRFYVPSCTSSTIAAAGMFAHAAYVFQGIPALAGDATALRTRAIRAFDAWRANPDKEEHCDTGIVKSGNADWKAADQDAAAVVAAIYLYAITGSPAYAGYVKDRYTTLSPYHDIGWTRYNAYQGEALLFYAGLPHADAGVQQSILTAKRNDASARNGVDGFDPAEDLYRNHLHDAQYHWGSNQVRANYGNSNADVLTYRVGVASAAPFELRALETLHYFHGVNPFAKVYLSNMNALGATSSVNAIFHTWYLPGTKWADAKTSACGPPPGYLPGGPVANAGAQGVPAYAIPPVGQPPQKSWRDWNGIVGNPQSSWVTSEPAIYYQAAYVELVSRFQR